MNGSHGVEGHAVGRQQGHRLIHTIMRKRYLPMICFIDLLERSRSVKLAMLHIRSTKYTIAALAAQKGKNRLGDQLFTSMAHTTNRS